MERSLQEIIWHRAVGVCEHLGCTQTHAMGIAGSAEDAELFLAHNHGHEANHWFVGRVTIVSFYAPAVRQFRRKIAA